jgi:hypothetical protein
VFCCSYPKQKVYFGWSVGRPFFKERSITMPLELRCTNEEKIPISVNPITAAGKPVELDGPIVVTVTSGDGTVESIDDRSFYVVSGDALEPSTFLIEGDADLGTGIVTVSDAIILNVEGAFARSLGLSAGLAVVK